MVLEGISAVVRHQKYIFPQANHEACDRKQTKPGPRLSTYVDRSHHLAYSHSVAFILTPMRNLSPFFLHTGKTTGGLPGRSESAQHLFVPASGGFHLCDWSGPEPFASPSGRSWHLPSRRGGLPFSASYCGTWGSLLCPRRNGYGMLWRSSRVDTPRRITCIIDSIVSDGQSGRIRCCPEYIRADPTRKRSSRGQKHGKA